MLHSIAIFLFSCEKRQRVSDGRRDLIALDSEYFVSHNKYLPALFISWNKAKVSVSSRKFFGVNKKPKNDLKIVVPFAYSSSEFEPDHGGAINR